MNDALRDRLLAAADGLLFSTESDRPFEFVRLSSREPIAAVTPESIAAMVGRPDAKAAEWPFTRFLARHIERADPLDGRSQAQRPRYEGLEAALGGALGAIRVFRIGEVEVYILALGNDPTTGELAGLTTVAVET